MREPPPSLPRPRKKDAPDDKELTKGSLTLSHHLTPSPAQPTSTYMCQRATSWPQFCDFQNFPKMFSDISGGFFSTIGGEEETIRTILLIEAFF